MPTRSTSRPRDRSDYFSDGQLHIAVATLSERGRRLFVDVNGDVIATNVIDYLPD